MGGANLLTKPMLLAFMDIFDALKVINAGTPTALDAPGVPPPRRPPLVPLQHGQRPRLLAPQPHSAGGGADVLRTINRGAAIQ